MRLRINTHRSQKREAEGKREISGSHIVINEKLKTRTEVLDGVKYLVAPVVMVKEQVLNGEFLPAEEIEKSVPGWNGRPVVVYHPKKGETDSSANDPDVVETYEIGRLYNVNYDKETTKLKGEIWVDISKARKNKDTRQAYKMIKNSDELEVSTGYFVNDRVAKEGTFNNVNYVAIQREILPDHLALLPNEIGACSWEDGAGVRNNSRRRIKLNIEIPINQAVMEALDNANINCDYIETILVDEYGITAVIYTTAAYDARGDRTYPNKTWKLDYTIDPETGMVLLGNLPTEVEPILQYINKNSKEEKKLSKKALVNAVITNSAGKFTKKDSASLMKLNESTLNSMLPAKARVSANKSTRNSRKVRRTKTNGRMSINEVMELPLDEITDYVETLMDDADSGDESAVDELEQLESELVAEESVLADVIDEIESFLDDETMGDPESMEDDEEDEYNNSRRGRRNKGRTRGRRANMDVDEIVDPDQAELEDDEVEIVEDLETLSSRRRKRTNKTKTRQRRNEDLESILEDEIDDVITLPPDANEAIKAITKQTRIYKNNLIKHIVANSDFRANELKGFKTNQLEKMANTLGIDVNNMRNNSVGYGVRGLQQNNKQNDNKGYTELSTNIFNPSKNSK